MKQEAPISANTTALDWRTSSFSGGQGNCVEVAPNLPHLVPVRDSKRPTGPVLAFGHAAWRTFVSELL